MKNAAKPAIAIRLRPPARAEQGSRGVVVTARLTAPRSRTTGSVRRLRSRPQSIRRACGSEPASAKGLSPAGPTSPAAPRWSNLSRAPRDGHGRTTAPPGPPARTAPSGSQSVCATVSTACSLLAPALSLAVVRRPSRTPDCNTCEQIADVEIVAPSEAGEAFAARVLRQV